MSKLSNTFNLKSNIRCISDNLNLILALILVCLLYSYVVKPTIENFNTSPVFRMYYADWCGYSQDALPKFRALGSNVNGITIEEVDCVAEKERCGREGINGYPTFILEKPGNILEPYTGARETDAMRLWLNTQ